jgi:hypothetical protein
MRPSSAAFRSAPVVLKPQYRVAATVVRNGGQGRALVSDGSGSCVRDSSTRSGPAGSLVVARGLRRESIR